MLGALCLATALSIATASAAAKPTPAPTASAVPEDPAVTKIARQQFVAWQAGVLDKDKYSAELFSTISDDKLKSVSTNLGHLGALTATEFVGAMLVDNAPGPGYRGFVYHFTTVAGAVYERLVLDPKNRVAGIIFSDKLPKAE